MFKYIRTSKPENLFDWATRCRMVDSDGTQDVVFEEGEMNSVIAGVPREVIKRAGRRTMFDAAKIRSAILRAGLATKELGAPEFGEAEAELLTAQGMKVLTHGFRAAPPDIERIQDVVEQSLIAANR